MSITVGQTKRQYRSMTNTKRRGTFGRGVVGYFVACADLFIIVAASALGAVTHNYMSLGFLWDPARSIGFGLLASVIFVLAMSCLHAYRYDELLSVRRQALFIMLLIPSVLAFLLAVVFFLKLGSEYSRGTVLHFAALSLIFLIGARLFWRRRLSRAVSVGWVRPKRAFFICPESLPTERLEQFSNSAEMRITQTAWLSDQPDCLAGIRQRLSEMTDANLTDEIVIVWQSQPTDRLEALLNELRHLPLPVKVVFDSFTGSVVSCHSEEVGGVIAFQVQSQPLVLAERFAKRAFDVLFSLLTLVLVSPLLLMIATAIKLDSRGPVLFRQRRRGLGNRPFNIIKFRSMTVLEDGEVVVQATKGDKRMTRVGAFIRAYSIDELPQFINVLRGEMSVVGPRPHAVAHDDVYDRMIEEYASRRHVKPGVTGWAQVKGYRGETPTIELMEQRVVHDLWYIDHWSLLLDLKIVARTVFALRGH